MTALRDWVHLETEVGDRAVTRKREATPDEVIELARELDILSCEVLAVDYALTPRGRGRFVFEGRLEAGVTQACVVTLEPVPARISEPFSVEFGPPELLEDTSAAAGEREVSSVPDVEPVLDGRIDIGTVVFGLLSAALPPYPRKEDAAFEWVDPKSAADPGEASPFAALAKLKPKP
jgi:uncharacterized metal-binding protein YceD (DUF177 family)